MGIQGPGRAAQKDGPAEEPSIATVTVVNAIHLQRYTIGWLKAPCEEKKNKAVLYTLPSLRTSSTMAFIKCLPICP